MRPGDQCLEHYLRKDRSLSGMGWAPPGGGQEHFLVDLGASSGQQF